MLVVVKPYYMKRFEMTIYKPYWWEDAPRKDFPRSSLESRTDVVILGSGYTGLSAALELARAGRSVQVFDKGVIGGAASSRSGGIASGNLRLSFTKMIDKLGVSRAKAFHGEAVKARRDLLDFIQQENIKCHYQEVGRFQGAVHPEHYDALGREVDNLNKHFDLGSYMVPKHEQNYEIGSDVFYGGAIRPDMNGLHPALFHQGLLECALKAGALVHANTPVLSIEKNTNEFSVETQRGLVKARDVIVATNGYTDQAAPWFRRRLVPVASAIICTDPIAPELMDELFPSYRMNGNSNNLHAYFRPSPDRTRVLYGGNAPRKLVEDGPIDYSPLKKEMIHVFPQLKSVGISHAWWGYVAMNTDFLPQISKNNGIYYVGGFCGSGVVWARWFGRKAAQKILGDPEGKSAFDEQKFRAIPLYNGNTWFLPGVIAWYKFRDAVGL